MVAALRRIGFDYVFDTDFAADLTIMEEGHELIERLNKFLKGEPVATPMCNHLELTIEFAHNFHLSAEVRLISREFVFAPS